MSKDEGADFKFVFYDDHGKIEHVNEENGAQNETHKPMGTLACLAMGFETVARHPVLITIPTVLDLFLWLGPRLSLAPIFRRAEQFVIQLLTMDGVVGEAEEAYLLLQQVFGELAVEFNLFAMLTPAPLLGVPSLMAERMSVLRPFGSRPEIVVASLFFVMAWVLILGAMGLLCSAFYLRTVGVRVVEELEADLPGPEGSFSLWWQLVKLAVILLAVLFSFSLLTSAMVSCIGLVSFPLAAFLMTLFSSLALFVIVHLIFAVPGIILLRRKPLQAMRESLLLTRGDFLNVTLLILLILIVSRGLNFVWKLPAPETWSTLIGIAGHAFVSSALTATLFVFYYERLQFLEVLMQAFATKEAPAQSLVGE